MISNVVAFGFAGMAAAAYAPPPVGYGAASSSAPAMGPPPTYGTATAPVYQPETSSAPAQSTETATYITCTEATQLTWYSSTIDVPHPTVVTLTHPPMQTMPAETTPCPTSTETPAPSQPAGDECAMKCNMDYDHCRTAPDANMAQCASEYASCVGYNPFTGSSFMSATACSSTPAPTGPAPPPHQTAPASAPAPSQPAGDECAMKCNMDYDHCRTAPDANMAQCASEYASCVGYNPFTGSSFMSATACSTSAGPGPSAPPATTPVSPENTAPAYVPQPGPPAPVATSPASPVQPPTYPANNATAPAGTGAPPAQTSPVVYQGAAAQVAAGAFTGIAAVLAFFL